MTMLVVGLVLFLGIHSVAMVSEGWRDGMVAKLGEGPWKGIYSLVSLVGFVLIVMGYGAARMSPSFVWAPPTGGRHLALLLLVPVFPLLFAAYLPGRISRLTRHPMLLGTALWGIAHLLANGMLADLALFGSFAGWALLDRLSFLKRTQRDIPMAPEGKLNDVIAVVGGLGSYVVFMLWLHPMLIGVAVM
ncbi:MAG: NnrU family protein [Deltaproteobacteria bacterium]|nr:NnrU family protein [Deltaproteobacteria bacterium]